MSKIINKTYQFRIYPTGAQERALLEHFGATRWAFNRFLNERIEHYNLTKKSLTSNVSRYPIKKKLGFSGELILLII